MDKSFGRPLKRRSLGRGQSLDNKLKVLVFESEDQKFSGGEVQKYGKEV